MNTQDERDKNDRVWKGKVTAKLEQIGIDQNRIIENMAAHLEKLEEFRERCHERHRVLDGLVVEQKGHITTLKDQMSRLFKVIIGATIIVIAAGAVHTILSK